MRIDAIFESWLVGDGNYRPPVIGDTGSLVLEFWSRLSVPGTGRPHIESVGRPEYRVTATVTGRHVSDNKLLLTLDAAGLQFYWISDGVGERAEIGVTLTLTGIFKFDHYLWSWRSLRREWGSEDPRDLFYDVRVERIRVVRVPERFITRSERVTSGPTIVGPEQYADEDVRDVQSAGDHLASFSFFIVELEVTSAQPARLPRLYKA